MARGEDPEGLFSESVKARMEAFCRARHEVGVLDVQREFAAGFSMACRLMDLMVRRGVLERKPDQKTGKWRVIDEQFQER